MTYPVAAGHPTYSGNFIPEIWSGKLLPKFYKASVFGDIANTDYEGEITKYGDKVHIRTVPDIIIRDYVAGQPLQNQRPNSDKVELLIDKGKYFSFVCDDVMRAQMDLAYMESWSNDASEQMKISIDSDILNAIYVDADAKNKGATAGVVSSSYNLGANAAPVVVTKSNVLDILVDCGSVLDEQNRPYGCNPDTVLAPPGLMNSGVRLTPDALRNIRNPGSQTGPGAMIAPPRAVR